ncbi:serine-rich adhesin for platelets-like isoform X2 [Watersipora subatra]|uniref:serine-rich adhesin for platelets-like isoform X2 n=1 Tax=Watersipora subatra TaxID=2589382 RepID=UPI00355AE35D
MSDNDTRMLEYEQREQEFFQFINQTRRDQDKPLTSDNCVAQDLAAPKGLQCLLALACLLEETVKFKLNKINSEKDLADLLELRRQAERMGHGEHKAPPNASEKQHGDNLSLSGEHRYLEETARAAAAVEHYSEAFPEPPKLKTHKSGSNMLTGTLGKMSKLLKTGHVNRESILPTPIPPSTASSGFAQRKLAKAHGTLPASLPASAQTSFDLGNSHVSSPTHFGQRHVETPPTPPDLGDIWLGTSGDKSHQPNETLPTSTPSQILVDRSISLCPHPSSPPQPVDAFTSLPDQLDAEHDFSANVELRERTQPERQTSYRKTHAASYEEAVSYDKVLPALSPPGFHPQAIHNQSSTDSLDAVDGRTKSLPMESLQHQLDLLNTAKNKDFAKKLERWVGKGKQTNKEVSKSKLSSGHHSKTKHKKKGGKQFNRQRSMSADRAGLLLKESSSEFEEKLRQWGIKQAHDPNYYLGNSERSRAKRRSVESPARLSRRDEKPPTHEEWVPLKRNSLKRASVEKTLSSSSVSSQNRRSIERGRRVSPTRVKHYTKTTQGSLKISSDSHSSESGSAEVVTETPTSPRIRLPSFHIQEQTVSSSISADSLLSTDDNGEPDNDYSSFGRHSLQRPLSMIGMSGSLENAEGNHSGIQSPSTRSSDSQLLSPSDRDMLRTIGEDINNIQEHTTHRCASSSDTSLEGSFEQISATVNIASPLHQIDITDEKTAQPASDSDTENTGVVLPSHSICVDSGMEMQDEEFYTTSCKKDGCVENEQTNSNNINKLNHEQDPSDNPQIQTSIGEAETLVNEDTELDNQNLVGSDLSQEHVLDIKDVISCQNDSDNKETNEQNSNGANNNGDVLTENSVNHEPNLPNKQDQPVNNEDVFVPIALETTRQNNSVGSGHTTHSLTVSTRTLSKPLEYLMTPQSVPLKVKLKRLSTLYDNEDAEDITTLNQELSSFTDVFATPSTPPRERSKSEPKLDEHPLEKKPELTSKQSSPGLSMKVEKLFVDTTGSKSQQASPMSRRRRLHSPVPIHDLVNKFDQQKSNNSSPAISPTHSQPPIVQMGKIVDRLTQPKGNQSNRYTVDLSRHVREVPKEGAVQRARSIFMDLQSS